MVTYQKKNESKSLLVSLFAHAILIGGYFLFLHQQSLTLIQSSKMVIMEIATLEHPPAPASPLIEPTIPPQEVIKEPIKPIEPVKSKPIAKPQPVVEKEIVQPVKEEMNVLSEPVSEQASKIVSVENMLSEPHVRIDFEIIRDKVLSYLVYPSTAKRMNWNGIVHVALEIDTSGYLLSATIHQSSGREMLDNAALDAANKLKNQQLPKPKSTSTVILPIAFKLR